MQNIIFLVMNTNMINIIVLNKIENYTNPEDPFLLIPSCFDPDIFVVAIVSEV